jgi:heme-degrading monooxygenase HmoA
MIARIWRGRTRIERAEHYERYLEATGFKDYDTTEGNMGLIALRKTDSASRTTEFLLISLWKSLASIKEFAGDDIEKAVYYPTDKEFLLEMEPNTSHYEVMVSSAKTLDLQHGKRTAKTKKKR